MRDNHMPAPLQLNHCYTRDLIRSLSRIILFQYLRRRVLRQFFLFVAGAQDAAWEDSVDLDFTSLLAFAPCRIWFGVVVEVQLHL